MYATIKPNTLIYVDGNVKEWPYSKNININKEINKHERALILKSIFRVEQYYKNRRCKVSGDIFPGAVVSVAHDRLKIVKRIKQ